MCIYELVLVNFFSKFVFFGFHGYGGAPWQENPLLRLNLSGPLLVLEINTKQRRPSLINSES